MEQMNKEIKIFLLLLLLNAGTFAQNNAIFFGGSADGWTAQNLVQASNNIFKGGSADGWSAQNYLQAGGGGNIFKGGSGDGWDVRNYLQGGGGTIYKGGSGDGWDSKNYIQSNVSLFKGGFGDGWDSKNYMQSNVSLFKGGTGDGWASVYRPQGTLPVTLLYFTARKSAKNSSLLDWKTSQEINSSHFDVERSGDAIIFLKIGTLQAAGNSSVPLAYSFTDNNPAKGMNYYRLKQADADGRFIYTPARLVTFDDLNAATVKYYPNPTNGILTIELSSVNGNEARVINITNATGAVVYQLKVGSSAGTKMQIDLSRYAKGTYYIQLRTPTMNSTERIVLQ